MADYMSHILKTLNRDFWEPTDLISVKGPTANESQRQLDQTTCRCGHPRATHATNGGCYGTAGLEDCNCRGYAPAE